MKKIYLSCLTLLAGFSLQAQLTQANQAPMASYSFQVYHCDSAAANVNPGASGANAVWNFSTMTTYSNLVNTYNTSAITGNPSYPSASVAVASGPNTSSYYSSTATELKYYGGDLAVGSIAASLIYTNAATFAAYPMNLNTATTSAIAGSVNVTAPLPVSGTFSGSCHVIADGSGTLILPGTNGTFTNVLRVITSQTINVTTSFANGTFYQTVYDYYAIGLRNPVFSITTATASIPGTSNTQTTVTRDKNATGTSVPTTTTQTTTVNVRENSANVITLNVYPNPSSSFVQFTTDSPEAKQVSIYDITGKLIDKQLFVDGKIKLDVSDLNSGLYMYTIAGSSNNRLKTGRLTVNH